jgi:hypothetical protein
MTKWEYNFVIVGYEDAATYKTASDMLDELDDAGKDGWELVLIYGPYAFLKRPLEEREVEGL